MSCKCSNRGCGGSPHGHGYPNTLPSIRYGRFEVIAQVLATLGMSETYTLKNNERVYSQTGSIVSAHLDFEVAKLLEAHSWKFMQCYKLLSHDEIRMLIDKGFLVRALGHEYYETTNVDMSDYPQYACLRGSLIIDFSDKDNIFKIMPTYFLNAVVYATAAVCCIPLKSELTLFQLYRQNAESAIATAMCLDKAKPY